MFESPVEIRVSIGQLKGAGALGAADLGDTACGLLEEVSINPTIELQADDPHTAE